MQPPRPHRERPNLPLHGRVEDYTAAFLWTAGVLTFVVLFAIWATWGLPFALIAAVIVDRLIPRG